MWIRFLVLAIILLPVFFVIYKFTYKALINVNAQGLVNDVNEKLDEFDRVHAAHEKVKDVDLDAVRKEKNRINQTLKD